jgi:hypothetical protein
MQTVFAQSWCSVPEYSNVERNNTGHEQQHRHEQQQTPPKQLILSLKIVRSVSKNISPVRRIVHRNLYTKMF